MNLKDYIASHPDFPKAGVNFYDISPLLADARAWAYTIDQLKAIVAPYQPQVIAAIESRGFLLAAPLAYALGVGYIMIRKAGKLPGKTVSYTYDLEYGTDTLEIQQQVVPKGKRVVLVDDVLATGGTMNAALRLLRQCEVEVPLTAGIMELTFLKGRDRLSVPFTSLVQYDS